MGKEKLQVINHNFSNNYFDNSTLGCINNIITLNNRNFNNQFIYDFYFVIENLIKIFGSSFILRLKLIIYILIKCIINRNQQNIFYNL